MTEQLKRFEFNVRRQLGDDKAVALSGSEEVPEAHKQLWEEYNKALARSGR